MLKTLYNAFRKKPKFLQDNAGKIKEAFVYRGVTYYMFDDIFQMPTIRGLQALDYYDEYNQRCTKDFLLKFCEAQEDILSNPKKLDLIRLATLTKYLRERLTMIPIPDHVYRLASVAFFDGTEDPFYFDHKKAAKKIAEWKKDPEVLSFFLRSPLKDLIPHLTTDGPSINTYSAITDKINSLHLKEVLLTSLDKGTKVGM